MSSSLVTLAGLISLSGVRFVEAQGKALPSGDNDLYACPSGKKAYVAAVSDFNGSAGSLVGFTEVKISGTYFRIGPLTSIGTLARNLLGLNNNYLLNAGEILAVNTSGAGFNVFPVIFEFDASAPLTTARINALAIGDNTLYTCPADKSALPINLAVTNQAFAGGNVCVVNDSGSSLNLIAHQVASGDAPGSGNETYQHAVPNHGFDQNSAPGTLSGGDSISLNVDVAGASAHVVVLEI